MARRDDAWLRDLHDSEWVRMVGLATLLLGSSDVAEEIVQDAFVAVHQRRHQFITTAHARAYLRTAVVNRTRSAHRHVVDEGLAENLAEADPSSHQVLARIDALPQKQREVLVLRYFCDAGESELAGTLGIMRTAVRSHTHRGLQTIRQVLAGDRDEATGAEDEDNTAALVRSALTAQASTLRPSDGFSRVLDRITEADRDGEPDNRFRSVLLACCVALAVGIAIPLLVPRLFGGQEDITAPPPPPSSHVTEASGPPSLQTLQRQLPIYYAGDRNLLYREFRDLPTQDDRLTTAVAAVLNVVPQDPAYTSLWAGGQVNSARAVGNRIILDISASAFAGFKDRATAQAAVQQIVYTAIATVGDQYGEKTVQLLKDGSPNLPVLGAPATDFVREGTIPLAPLWLDTPSAAIPSGAGKLSISGFLQTGLVSNKVEWEVLDKHGKTLAHGQTAAEGDAQGWATWHTYVVLDPGEYSVRVWSLGVEPFQRHFKVA